MKKHLLSRNERKALLQIVSGLFLISVVLVFALYQTDGFGTRVYAGEVVMGENISAEIEPALYLSAATYGVIGMDITEEYYEEVLLASAEAETAGRAADGLSSAAAGGSSYISDEPEAVYLWGSAGDGTAEEDKDETSESDEEEEGVAEESGDETQGAEEEKEDAESSGDDSEEDSAEETPAETDASEVEEEASAEDTHNDTNETRETEDPADAEEPVYVAYDSSKIISMIRTKRYNGNIDVQVAELANCPDDRARDWEEIFAYWNEVNGSGFITKYNPSSGANPSLPGNLPNNDTLCFVVLGCGLNANGTIRPEMECRCQTALKCAEMYPNSYVLCTGGHTAGGNYAASEGGVMGNWLIEHGVDASRVIIEDASYQTCENAMKSVPLLMNRYPQVKTLVLVTSDYHVPLGALTLQAECILDGDLRVVANVGCSAPRYVNFGNGELGKQLEKLAFTCRR